MIINNISCSLLYVSCLRQYFLSILSTFYILYNLVLIKAYKKQIYFMKLYLTHAAAYPVRQSLLSLYTGGGKNNLYTQRQDFLILYMRKLLPFKMLLPPFHSMHYFLLFGGEFALLSSCLFFLHNLRLVKAQIKMFLEADNKGIMGYFQSLPTPKESPGHPFFIS